MLWEMFFLARCLFRVVPTLQPLYWLGAAATSPQTLILAWEELPCLLPARLSSGYSGACLACFLI